MNKYSEKAIPLVLRSGEGKYSVNQEALDLFASIPGKIAIISVAGVYRTGKSFLLNKMLLNQKNGFAVGPTTNAKTKGIWVWGTPIVLKNAKDEIINLLVMDSEGLGSTDEDINHDLRLFSLTLMLSSTFLYNTVGAIDENAIDSLGLVLRLCEHLKSSSYNDFPEFYWILRDFSLALVDKDNSPLTTKAYLENCLSSQPGDSADRNKIRNVIREAFDKRACFTFIRPLTDEKQLQNLDQMSLDQLRPEFVQQVLHFRKSVFSAVKTKTIKGKEVKGTMFCDLVKVYVEELNGDGLPYIETGWKYVLEKECQKALDVIEEEMTQALEKVLSSLPSTKAELEEQEKQILKRLRSKFKSIVGENSESQRYLAQITQQLSKKMKATEEQMKTRNQQETKSFIRKQFDAIEKRVRQGQFKDMSELTSEFEVFQDFYRKKCPYKDEIQTGLQYLIKKFCDATLLLYKSLKNKKDAEIKKMKTDIDRSSQQLIQKEEKARQDKTAMASKVAILESKLDEVNRQNNTMTSSMVVLQTELSKVKTQFEDLTQSKCDALELQAISLKKKLIEAQDRLHQLENTKNTEINGLRKEVILLQNERVHNNNENMEASIKIDGLQQTLKNLKSEHKTKLDQLNNKILDLEKSHGNQIKALEEELSNRESSLQRAESSLESQNLEIDLLKKANEETMTKIQGQLEAESAKVIQAAREQGKIARQDCETKIQNMKMQVKTVENECAQKEMALKMIKMESEKEKALLNQKIDFMRKECEDREAKISRLLAENNSYAEMYEEKDSQIASMNALLDTFKITHQSSSEEFSQKFNELSQTLSDKVRQNTDLEHKLEHSVEIYRQLEQKHAILVEQHKTVAQVTQNKLKEVTENYEYDQREWENQKSSLTSKIQELQGEQEKMLEEQKRNAELSLVQLKNYYEMEKERLEKRNLEDKKRHEYLEANLTQQLEKKHKKTTKAMHEEMAELKEQLENTEEECIKMDNEFESRLAAIEEERQNERRAAKNKYESLEKKYQQVSSEFIDYEKSNEDGRIGYVKKIETLNFEVSRKEKELAQLVSKKQSLEANLAKKDIQIDNVKKLMNQEIENSLKKVAEIQSKYQRLNEQYMETKISAEQQIALSQQRNEFLTAKIAQLTKERESGSYKNLQKLQKQKISDFKDLVERQKTQLNDLQAKLQNIKKNSKETEAALRKQVAKLEKENSFLSQKVEGSESKTHELDVKILQKNQFFTKELEESRQKFQTERHQLQKDLDETRSKLTIAENQLSEVTWKMQKEVVLLNDRIKYADHQRDQAKKEAEESERRLQISLLQLRKAAEKNAEDQQAKKDTIDRKFSIHMEAMKESIKSRNEEQEETIKRLKEEHRQLRQKNNDLNQKLQKAEKAKAAERGLQEEIQHIKRQKEAFISSQRTERARQNEEWRKRIMEAEKRQKDAQRKYNDSLFSLEKEQTRWALERQTLADKIKNLENQLEWERNKSQLIRTKNDNRKSVVVRSSSPENWQ